MFIGKSLLDGSTIYVNRVAPALGIFCLSPKLKSDWHRLYREGRFVGQGTRKQCLRLIESYCCISR